MRSAVLVLVAAFVSISAEARDWGCDIFKRGSKVESRDVNVTEINMPVTIYSDGNLAVAIEETGPDHAAIYAYYTVVLEQGLGDIDLPDVKAGDGSKTLRLDLNDLKIDCGVEKYGEAEK